MNNLKITGKKGLSYMQIGIMILGFVSFVYLVGAGEMVSAEEISVGKTYIYTQGDYSREVMVESISGGDVISDNGTIRIPLTSFKKYAKLKEVMRDVSVAPPVTVAPTADVTQLDRGLGNIIVGGTYIYTQNEEDFDITVGKVEGREFSEDGNTKIPLDSFKQNAQLKKVTKESPPDDSSDGSKTFFGQEWWRIAPGSGGGTYWFGSHLIQGVVYGLAVGKIASGVYQMFGGDEGQAEAFDQAIFAGVTTFYGARGAMTAKWWFAPEKTAGEWIEQDTWLGRNVPGGQGVWDVGVPLAVGALVAWAVYTSQYEKEKKHKETVSFQCLPWQAPRGGNDCELCNEGDLPCSEYRCKSLGQSCEIINKGTEFEQCVNQFRGDTNPPVITPWEDVLTEGYRYDNIQPNPPSPGFQIKRSAGADVCVKAFTPIEFGIITDEPSQCKIDVEYKDDYDSMSAYFGGDTLFSYNHSEYLSLPKARDLKNSSINLEMGNKMTLYVRCTDSQGNINQAPLAVSFCVDSAPDNTVPQIKATSIESDSCVAADRNSSTVSFYTDEPSQCKWGFDDQNYDSLPYNMSCTTQIYQINSMMLYTCTTDLTSVARTGTNYYVRCEDKQTEPKADRNSMQQSFSFSLRGSNPLKLKSVLPNGTIYGGVSPMRVELKAETLFGCDNNKAVCFYSSTGNANDYVMFFDTDKSGGVHTQMLDLYSGTHTYFVKCVDAGGNVAESNTTFNLDIDTTSPIVTRAYFDEDYLKVVTIRDSECKYSTESCDFLFEEGQTMPYSNSPVHIISWEEGKEYFIKCRDEFRNEPVDCSIRVKPKENFLNY